MLWARLLAYITGTVNQELLLRNEYLAAENRILKGQIKGRLLLSEEEKATLAEIAHRLGRKALEEVAATAKRYDSGLVSEAHRNRDTKFCESFRELIESGSVNPLRLPARSPNLNSYAERWVRSVKEECLAKLILVGESSLRRALQQYLLHYHEERNHQGKENRILFPFQTEARREEGAVRCRERLGGLLKYYEREAA